MKVIDMLTLVDFHGAFQKLLEWYKCNVARGDYLEGDKTFTCVLSIKVPIRKKSGNLFNDPCKQLQSRSELILLITFPMMVAMPIIR